MATVLGPRKTIEETIAATEVEGEQLKRDLGGLDLIVLGVGVMIGAGIFVLTGVAASEGAGPSIVVSYVLAAVVCGLAALCYAELASTVPVAGSTYTYTYATVGQTAAFLIGWILVLEFTIGAAAVSVGFAGNLNGLLAEIGIAQLPAALTSGPFEGGAINLVAILLALLIGAILVRGIRSAAKFNGVLVVGIVAVLLFVIVVGGVNVDTVNWRPFAPGGFGGVMTGASLVFFAYIGFDVVATAAEETKEPKRDMPIGIIGSLVVVTVLYVLVAGVLTGIRPYQELGTDAPVAEAFGALGIGWAAIIIFIGALMATLNTVLVLVLGQTRVAFAMARDRLIPGGLAATHPRHGTPARLTWITTGVVCVLAGFVPLTNLAELVNIGTLVAFGLVSVAVVYLRYAEPHLERSFKVPFMPVLPALAIVGCVALAITLPGVTLLTALGWAVLGVIVYVLYAAPRSPLRDRDRG